MPRSENVRSRSSGESTSGKPSGDRDRRACRRSSARLYLGTDDAPNPEEALRGYIELRDEKLGGRARLSTWQAVVEEVTAMINAAYAAGEQGMWRPDTPRIFEAEVRALLDAGELVVVRRDGVLAGCVQVHALDAATGELGLLSAARRDSGVGRELVALAEAWARERGLSRMQLKLLVPRTGTHPFKARLHAWYSKLGYRVTARRDFADELPESARLLNAPCDLVRYEKAL
jgi:N-acetylglutamate synthase-like GNAT family acetyltransferase